MRIAVRSRAAVLRRRIVAASAWSLATGERPRLTKSCIAWTWARCASGSTRSSLASAPWTAAPDAESSEALGREQPDDRDQRFVVGEHQRGQLESTPEAVAARRAALGLDRDAHVLQPGDVATNRPWAHLEPVRDLLGVELPVHLEQLDEGEKPAD